MRNRAMEALAVPSFRKRCLHCMCLRVFLPRLHFPKKEGAACLPSRPGSGIADA